jgi:hypothetical protein
MGGRLANEEVAKQEAANAALDLINKEALR